MSDFADRFEDRYPEHRTILEQLCQEDEFRELCDHYAECRGIVRRLLRTSGSGQQRVREYQDLVHDLEAEIQEIIGTHKNTDETDANECQNSRQKN